jgi:ferritin-like metal-binding protein YciE
MASIKNERQLLVEELGAMLYVEQELVEKVLPELIGEIRSEELKSGIRRHLEQTRTHVANLERAFELLGEEPDTEKSVAFEGLTKQHKLMARKVEDHHLEDVVHAAAASKTEQMEIAGYRVLITLAEAVDEQEIVGLLEENLDQEKEALKEVEQASTKLSRTAAAV